MGLTTSLYTGLSGLIANSTAITVTGNNIANANTTAYKSSQTSFETQISQMIAPGSAPSAQSGGTNPAQIGLGVREGSIVKNFTGGTVSPTGVNTDLAIEGNGFFIVQSAGSERFTRDGHFSLDRNYNLVSANGGQVMGYGVDDNFQVSYGQRVPLVIPIGSTLAEATENIRFSGNLNAGGNKATQGSRLTFGAMYSDAAATTAAVGADDLVDLYNADGDALFADGDVITVSGMTKGGATLPDKTFEVGAANTTDSDAYGATVDDFMAFLQDILGIDTSIDGGVSIVAGQITVEGNTGSANDILIENGNLVKNVETAPELPFTVTKDQSADGESVRTSFIAYDTLGNPMSIDLTAVLVDKTNAGTTWQFYAQSEDDSDLSRLLGNGLMTFNNNGQLVSVTGSQITIDRADSGAFASQTINLDFSGQSGLVTALRDTTSQLSAISQDGTPFGSLEDFAIGEDGTITGVYSNSQLRTLGKVVLAMFANPQGLEDMGGNVFRPTVNSGDPSYVSPQSGGAGKVVGSALELSNVELSQEFISLITASTGFSASSRVLSTSDQLMQELLATLR